MSEVSKYKDRKDNTINVTEQKTQSNYQFDANRQNFDLISRLPDYVTSEREYFDNLIENNLEENLALQLKAEKNFEDVDIENVTIPKGTFKQVLPIAKNDKAARKADEKALKSLKKKYSYADLCTAREHTAMNQYLSNASRDTEALRKGSDSKSDPYLVAYVDSMLSVEINEKTFTDEYLSNHIVTLFQYCKDIKYYNSLRIAYPSFFENLSDEKKALLDNRADMANDLAILITAHMKAHGIVIKTAGGRYKADLLKEATDKKQREKDHKDSVNDYEKLRKEFFEKNFKNEQLLLADVFISEKDFKSEEVLRVVTSKINAKQGLPEEKTVKIQAAKDELKKVLTARDEFISTLLALRGMTYDVKEKDIQEKIERRIAKGNRRVSFTTKCADYYREYIDYQLGEITNLSMEASRFMDNQQKVKNAQVQEQPVEKQEVAASAAYSAYKNAADSLGTSTIFEKINMTLVKNALKEFQDNLKSPIGTRQKKDFYTLKISVLTSINRLSDACDHYMIKKEADKETNSTRYGYVKTIKEQMAQFKAYYESLSEERFEAAKVNARTFGEIMQSDNGNIVENEAEKELSADIMRSQEANAIPDLIKALLVGPYDYGHASHIRYAEKDLTRLLKEQIPFEKEEFDKAKDKILGVLDRAINACDEYSTHKVKNPPKLKGGKDRLNVVRQLMGIYTRQFEYLKTIDHDELQKVGKLSGTFENVFNGNINFTTKNELSKRQNIKFVGENADVAYEADLLSGMLGVKGIYGKTEKAIVTEGKQNFKKGFIQTETPIQDSSVKKGNKKINQVLSFAKEQKLDVAYSDAVLKQFSTIRIMDFLTGRENRGDEDLIYNTEVTTVAGREVVNISSVKSINERASFSKKDDLDPVQRGLVDKNGRFLMPYDTKFADRVMKTDADMMLNNLVKQGARLDNETKQAFKTRYQKLQELFVKDKETGWRSEFNKMFGKDPEDYEIRDEFSRVEVTSLPSYMKKELVSTIKKYDPIIQSEHLDKTNNRWIDKNGNLKYEVRTQFTEEDNKKLAEIKKIKNKEERELQEKILVKKKRIQAIQEYKKSDSSSAFKMKKQKSEFIKLADEDLKTITKDNSETYTEIIGLVSGYGNILSTAQYQRQDEQIRRLEIVENETNKDRYKRVFEPKRGKEETDTLNKLRDKIDKHIETLDEKKKKGIELSAIEQKEYDKVKKYKKKIDTLCNGNLKVPKAKNAVSKVGEEQAINEIIRKKVTKEKDPIFVNETKDTLVKVTYEEKEQIDFEVIVEYDNENEASFFSAKDIAEGKEMKLVDLKELRGGMKKESYKMRDETKTPLFSHEPCMEDICQGFLGDCYALAALAALVEKKPEAIKNMMRDNGDGTVTVKLYNKKLEEVYVTVKKEVPINPDGMSDSDDYYAQNCLWVQMIEKAFVVSGLTLDLRNEWHEEINDGLKDDKQFTYEKLSAEGQRTYESIQGGQAEQFLAILTGNITKRSDVEISKLPDSKMWKEFYETEQNKESGKLDFSKLQNGMDRIIADIKDAQQDTGKVIVASTRNDIKSSDGKGHSGGESVIRGLCGRHAYTVLGLRTIDGEPYVALRNPWGRTVANLDVNEITGEESMNINKFEATQFVISVKDFLRYFSRYAIVNIDSRQEKV